MRTAPLCSLMIALTAITACKSAPSPRPADPIEAPRQAPAPIEARASIERARRGVLAAAALGLETARRELSGPERAFALLKMPKEERGPRDLVIVAVGDVSQPTTQWVERTEALGREAFGPTRALAASGDLVAMNLENPITELSPSAKKTYAFTSKPERLGWYFDEGYNLFSLANNHIADADQPGIDDTLTNLAAQRERTGRAAWWAGAGATPEEGESAVTIEPPSKELKIAFFSTGFSKSPNASKFWSETLPDRIREADRTHDVVIVSVHAGKEYLHVPKPDLQQRYRDWIELGADLVIGHHPHVVRPAEVYRGGLILHSLGNHVFASRTVRHRKMGAKLYGMVARIVIADGRVAGVELTPTWANNSEDWVLEDGQRLKNANFAPVPLTGDFADAFFEDFNAWSIEAGATVPDRRGDAGWLNVPIRRAAPDS